MFDVGFAELILLFIIGLLVLGPERLPKVARTLGGLTRKARSSWLNLKRSIEAEIRAEELKQPLEKFQKDVRSAVDTVNRRVDTMQREVQREVRPTDQPKDKPEDRPESQSVEPSEPGSDHDPEDPPEARPAEQKQDEPKPGQP